MHLPILTKRGREIAAADAFVSAGDRFARLQQYGSAAQSYENALRALGPYKGSRGVDPRIIAIEERAKEARRRSQPIAPPPIPLLPAPVTPLPDIYPGADSGASPSGTGRDREDPLYKPIERGTSGLGDPDYNAILEVDGAIRRLRQARQEGADLTAAENHLREARRALDSGDYDHAYNNAHKAYRLAEEAESRARASQERVVLRAGTYHPQVAEPHPPFAQAAEPAVAAEEGELPDYIKGPIDELKKEIDRLGLTDVEGDVVESLGTGIFHSRNPEEAQYYFDLARNFVDMVKWKRRGRAGLGREVVDTIKGENPGRADGQGNIVSDSTVGGQHTGAQPGDAEMAAGIEAEAEAARQRLAREITDSVMRKQEKRRKAGDSGTVSTGPRGVVIDGAVIQDGGQVRDPEARRRALEEVGRDLDEGN